MTWEIVIILILAIYSVLVSFFCTRFALTILRIQDTVENSLDALDERYQSISNILQRPLFFDSPEVRQVLIDINGTRDSILEIASALSDNFIHEEVAISDKADLQGEDVLDEG